MRTNIVNQYYALYLESRVLHFNALECGSYDFQRHHKVQCELDVLRLDVEPETRQEVEREVDGIFDQHNVEAA
jgi:hypothetical protein